MQHSFNNSGQMTYTVREKRTGKLLGKVNALNEQAALLRVKREYNKDASEVDLVKG